MSILETIARGVQPNQGPFDAYASGAKSRYMLDEIGRQETKRSALESLAPLAASGDRKALGQLAAVDPEAARSIAGTLKTLGDAEREGVKQFYDLAGRALVAADTPEKFDAVMKNLSGVIPQAKNYVGQFGQRDSLINMARSVKETLDSGVAFAGGGISPIPGAIEAGAAKIGAETAAKEANSYQSFAPGNVVIPPQGSFLAGMVGRGASMGSASPTIMAESGGRLDARNPNSSATGPGQFINGTWLEVVKKFAPEVAQGRSDEEILALRTDPKIGPALNERMVNAYGEANTRFLNENGVENVGAGERYLAHFAGPAGALSVLQADPNTPVSSILSPEAVQANPFLRNMTAGGLRNWSNAKMARDGGRAPSGAQPQRVQVADASGGLPAGAFVVPDPKLANGPKRGLTPVYGKDANGNDVIIQLSEDGTATQTPLPNGVTLSNGAQRVDLGTEIGLLDRNGTLIGRIPKDIAGEEVQKARGKAQGQREADAPATARQADLMLSAIDGVLNHPGREFGTGKSARFNIMPGTDGYDFQKRLDQLGGMAFLQAFESLKGGGQITEVEGKKATEAIARLDPMQSEEGFVKALQELRSIVEAARNRSQQQAGPQATSQPQAQPAAPAALATPAGGTPPLPPGFSILE